MKKLSTFLVLLVFLMTVAFSFPTASADTKFKVTSSVTSNSVSLKWNKLSGAKYYQVYRKTAKTKYKVVCTKTTNKSFASKNLKSGTKYTFKVTAFKKNAKGKFYGFKSATVTATPKFKLTTSATQNQATLKWNKADGAKYYKVYRKTADTSYKLVCKKTTSRTFVSKNLKANTKYTFKVKAYKKNKKGNYYVFKSATTSVKTKGLTPQATPTTTTVTAEQYFTNLSEAQKFSLISLDLGMLFSWNSSIEEFETHRCMYTEEIPYDNSWGYSAKIKLDASDYEKLSNEFESPEESETFNDWFMYYSKYSWWNLDDFSPKKRCYRRTTNISSVKGQQWTDSEFHLDAYIGESAGEFYLFVTTNISKKCEEFIERTFTKKPNNYSDLCTFFDSMTNEELLQVIVEEYEIYLGENAVVENFEKRKSFRGDSEQIYGFEAKIKLDKEGFDFINSQITGVEIASDYYGVFNKTVHPQSWWNLDETNFVEYVCYGVARATCVDAVTFPHNIMVTAKIDGEYYLFLDCPISELNEYYYTEDSCEHQSEL